MKTKSIYTLWVGLFVFIAMHSSAQVIDSSHQKDYSNVVLSTDQPRSNKKKIYQQIDYKSPVKSEVNIHIRSYQLQEGDSICLYNLHFTDLKFKKGKHKLQLDLQKSKQQVYADNDYYDILKKIELMPPGKYITYLDITAVDSTFAISKAFPRNIDSVLNHTRRNSKRVERKTGRIEGVQSLPKTKEGKSYSALYHKNWFLGYNGLVNKNSVDKIPDSMSLVCYVDLPYSHRKEVFQDLFIKNGKTKVKAITITCFDVTKEKDSVKVFSVKTKAFKARRRGTQHTNINLSRKRDSLTLHPLYEKIILNNGSLPAGNYYTHLTLQLKDGVVRKSYIHSIDSMFSVSSETHNAFDKVYSSQGSKKLLGLSFNHKKTQSRYNNTPYVIKKSSKGVDDVFKAKGFTVSYRNTDNKTFADVHCQKRYVGYYEIDMNEPITDKINKRKEKLNKNITAGINPNLENKKPVFSQIKEVNGGKKVKEIKGRISVTGNVASGQEENSQSENNYYEVTGQLEVPIMGVPILFEGYYTTQDMGRTAKAGYLRIHYDAEQAKSELIELISGFKNKYDRASSSGKSMENIYGTYLSMMAKEKGKLWSDMATETGVDDIGKFKADTSGLFKEITSACEKKLNDSLSRSTKNAKDNKSKALEARHEAKERYGKAIDKYKRIQQAEGKIQHYNTLLQRYRENNYYDSLIAYSKLKNIDRESLNEKSYKQLSKSASSLLPPGDNKKFIAGLTSLDIGIFSKQISEYSLNGQTIKGVDVGYDLGIFETGFTYGKVEYVSRDGFMDKYSGYSGRASFKPTKGHKTSLIYFGYTPSSRMLNEDKFFKDVDIHMPVFKNSPINILSITHSGEVSKNIKVGGEVAASYRTIEEFKREDTKNRDKMSYRIEAEGQIPQTTIDLKSSYEHIGKHFENNTLPLTLSGTEKYSTGATGQFLKNFLTLGVEYNYLIQQNFASKSVNSKWGFEVKTTSRRYPSASLSYKPFATFRSFSDTLNMPQRPILGEVWLGKLSYQIKNKVYALRLTLIYNSNTALVDTMESNSNIKQLNTIYTRGKVNLMLNAGQTQMSAGNISPVHGKTNFLAVGVGYNLNSQWTVSAGQDVGTSRGRLSRYATNMGCSFRFKNTPLSIRSSFRYNTYKISESQTWKNVYAGMLDISWQFRAKMNDRI